MQGRTILHMDCIPEEMMDMMRDEMGMRRRELHCASLASICLQQTARGAQHSRDRARAYVRAGGRVMHAMISTSCGYPCFGVPRQMKSKAARFDFMERHL